MTSTEACNDPDEIVRRAARVAREKILPLASRYDEEGAFPDKIYDILREEGLTAMTVPRRYGGLGLDLPTYCRVLAEIALGDGSTALTLNMHSSIVRVIAAMADETQKQRYLTEAARGRLFASLTSEPGSSLRRNFRVETTAVRAPGGWRLKGFKYFCSLSTAADYFFVWTMPEGRDDLRSDLLNLVVPADSEGVRIEHTWKSMAMRATASNSVAFEDVFVPEDAVVGGPGGVVRHGLTDVFIPGYAALYTGLAAAALERTVEYARERRFGEATVADDRVVQHHVGEMACLVAGARAVTIKAAEQAEAGDPRRALTLNQAKYLACNAATRVSDLALRVMGGRALYLHERLQRIFRDAHVGTIMPPSNDHSLEIVGKLTLGFQVEGGFLG